MRDTKKKRWVGSQGWGSRGLRPKKASGTSSENMLLSCFRRLPEEGGVSEANAGGTGREPGQREANGEAPPLAASSTAGPGDPEGTPRPAPLPGHTQPVPFQDGCEVSGQGRDQWVPNVIDPEVISGAWPQRAKREALPRLHTEKETLLEIPEVTPEVVRERMGCQQLWGQRSK